MLRMQHKMKNTAENKYVSHRSFLDFTKMKIGDTYAFQSGIKLFFGFWHIDRRPHIFDIISRQETKQCKTHINIKDFIAINNGTNPRSSILCKQNIALFRRNSSMQLLMQITRNTPCLCSICGLFRILSTVSYTRHATE